MNCEIEVNNYMGIKDYFYQFNYILIPRTAIAAEIHFQALYVRVQRLKTSLTKCQTRSCMEPPPSMSVLKKNTAGTKQQRQKD